MFDIESIIKKHAAADGSIPAEAVVRLAQAVNSSVGREFVEKARYNEKLTELETLKTEKQTAEDSAATAGKWKERFEALHGEFDAYKAEVTAKETRAAKEAAVRAYYQSRGITGRALEIAMRASGAEIQALELEEGGIKDVSSLEALVSGDFSALVGQTRTEGAPTATPPANTGGGLTRADIYKKDGRGRYVMSAGERQKALVENNII